MNDFELSIIIPAYNEEGAIGATLTAIQAALKTADYPWEVLVISDGSTDGTVSAAKAVGAHVVEHPINSGYGRSLLTGIRRARYSSIAILDADGTYPVERLNDLIGFYRRGFDMVVGARTGPHLSPHWLKRVLRIFFRWLAEFTTGQRIPDINSGFRIFAKAPVLAWQESLSMGFSFTTTITLLFMLNHYFVGYLPIDYRTRQGTSKVRLWRDSLRSLQIIVTTIAQYNPLKLFLLLMLTQALGSLFLLLVFAGIGLLLSWQALCLIGAMFILSLQMLKPRPVSSR